MCWDLPQLSMFTSPLVKAKPMSEENDLSVKGLDDFSRQFLASNTAPTEEEYVNVTGGQEASKEAIAKYHDERKTEFIKRAGNFTEDLVAFIVEQKKMRGLSAKEVVFAVALTNINLRSHYGRSTAEDASPTEKTSEEYLKEFDTICWAAQQFWDANQ